MILSFVIALQMHCGIQQIGSNTLSYGLLVYTVAGSSQPQVAHFQETPSVYREHALCRQLREKMATAEAFQILLSRDGKNLLEVR